MAALLVGGFVLISRNVNTGGLVAIAAGGLWFLVVGLAFLYRARGQRREQLFVLGTITAVALGSVLFATSRGNEVDEDVVTGVPAAAAEPTATGAPSATTGPSDAGRQANAGRRSNTRGRADAGGRSDKGVRSDARGRRDAEARSDETAPSDASGRADTSARPGTAAPSGAEQRRPAGNVQTLSGTFSGESGHRGSGKAAVVELPTGGRKLTFTQFDVDPGAGGLRVYLTAGNPRSDADVSDFKELDGLKGTEGDQQYDVPQSIDLKKYSTVVIWCVPFTTRIAQARLQ